MDSVPSTPGGIIVIKGFERSLQVECIARFAVDEYNIKKNALVLEFKKVLDAKQQLVVGIKYYLTLEVFDRVEKEEKLCETIVLVKPDYSKELLKFIVLQDG